jgi:hypothetical protein
MKESKAYQEILEEGRNSGLVEANRSAVIEVALVRFGQRGADSLKTALKSIDDPERLRALHKLALRCSRIDELVKDLSN